MRTDVLSDSLWVQTVKVIRISIESLSVHELLMKVAGMRLKVIFLPAFVLRSMGNELVPSPLLAESSFISETHLRVRKYACAYHLAQQLQ